MNVKEIISSGMLEAYVLGQLSEADRASVEKIALKYVEVRNELELVEASIEALAFKTSMNPPSKIKESVIRQVSKVDSKIKTLPNSNYQSIFFKYATAASIVIAIGASALAFNFWNKWQSAENDLTELIAQNDQIAQNFNQVNQQLLETEKSLAILNDQSFTKIIMNGTDNSPESAAIVHWNQNSNNVFLSIQNMSELSPNQQYQLWAIIDGKPVDAGVFNATNSNQLLQMKNVSGNVAAFAVTIEPKGGSENPTLETMQVLGNV